MKKVLSLLVVMSIVFAFAVPVFAGTEVQSDAHAKAEGLFIANFYETANSGTMTAGDARDSTEKYQAGWNGYNPSDGVWNYSEKTGAVVVDGENGLGVDGSNAAVVEMNGLLGAEDRHLNYVSAHNYNKVTVNTGTSYKLVYTSIMMKLKDDSQTEAVGVMHHITTDKGFAASAGTSDKFALRYPYNGTEYTTALTADWLGQEGEGSFYKNKYLGNNTVAPETIHIITKNEWHPLRVTMYYGSSSKPDAKISMRYMFGDTIDPEANRLKYTKKKSSDGTKDIYPGYTGNATVLLDDYIMLVVDSDKPLSKVYPMAYGAKLTDNETYATASANVYDVNAYATAAPAYQWQRKVDGEWINISGATSADYTFTEDDSSKEIRCQVAATSKQVAADGTETTVSSLSNGVCSYTPVITAPVIGGEPTISVVSNIVDTDGFTYTDKNDNQVTENRKSIYCYCKIDNYTSDVTSYGVKFTVGSNFINLPGANITSGGDFGIRMFGNEIDNLAEGSYTVEGYME